MNRVVKWLPLLLLICSTAFAQLTVEVKKAKSVVTAITVETMQLQTLDGDVIGEESSRELPPAVRPGVDAAVIFVKTDRPIDEMLVKIKCKTAEPIRIESGVYVVTKPGKHELEINVIGQNPLSWDDETVMVEVGQGPNPPPTPPGPTPPTPDPNYPAPIDGPGLRVLFISETGASLPREIDEAFYSTAIASYLNANCAKVDGFPDFRRVDTDDAARFTDPNHRFAKALARPRTALPWLIISNGVTGYEGPFPGGEAATLELIKSFNTPQSVPHYEQPLVIVHTIPNCVWCDKFKNEEIPHIKGVDFRFTVGGATDYPSFTIKAHGKSQFVSGFLTRHELIKIIDEMR